MTADETNAEMVRLQKMLANRKGKPGFGENVREIERQIAALQQQMADQA